MRLGTLFTILSICISALIQSGCFAGREYANVTRNYSIESEFRKSELLPDYRYYYSGPDSLPIALLMLDRNYSLESKFWHEFTSKGLLAMWMAEFDRAFGEYDDVEQLVIRYRGFEIRSKEGTVIGKVYSKYYWIISWYGVGDALIIPPPSPSSSQRPFRFGLDRFRRW